MSENQPIQAFLDVCRRWVCEDYSLDIRYLAIAVDDGHEIVDATIMLNPLPAPQDNGLCLVLPAIAAGQLQGTTVDKESLLAVLGNATSGTLNVHNMKLVLPQNGPYQIQSALTNRNNWFSPLHLQVIGRAPIVLGDRLAQVDNALRASTPPFDGLTDLSNWLALKAPDSGHLCSVTIIVSPPVDILIDRCQLAENKLLLTLHAHPKLNIAQVCLAVRAAPGNGLQGRLQVAEHIVWGEVKDQRREGIANIEIPNADSALIMLMIGDDTVRRHWFVDPTKAANHRMVAVQQFDRDLRMIRQGLFEVTDSSKFEMAVAALLFLLGFAPMVQLETNSPDLIVATPHGRLIIMECTTRVADVVAKVGKLVDRRGALAKALQASSHATEIMTVLVCRLPKDQIAAHAEYVRSHGVILVTAEALNDALLRTRFPSDPDLLFNQAQQGLTTSLPAT